MKKKPGPKSSFLESHCERLIAHMAEGYSFESFAGVVGKTRSTVYDWLEKHPEFKEAKEMGASASLWHWERLMKQAISRKDVNATLIIFNMCNRFKDWKQRAEQSVKFEVPDDKREADRLAKEALAAIESP